MSNIESFALIAIASIVVGAIILTVVLWIETKAGRIKWNRKNDNDV